MITQSYIETFRQNQAKNIDELHDLKASLIVNNVNHKAIITAFEKIFNDNCVYNNVSLVFEFMKNNGYIEYLELIKKQKQLYNMIKEVFSIITYKTDKRKKLFLKRISNIIDIIDELILELDEITL